MRRVHWREVTNLYYYVESIIFDNVTYALGLEYMDKDHLGDRFQRVVYCAAIRISNSIKERYMRWLARARTHIAYRPGGPGYLVARRRFMVNAGQSRRTRRSVPY